MTFSDFDAVLSLAQSRAPESLQLEFKEKKSPDKPELDGGDKKAIAKAVCAFANSGGGTLIVGIRSEKIGDLDVAAEVRPISEPDLCRTQVEYVCKTNVAPEIAGIEVAALKDPGGKGVIVCHVPESERRPHMSTAPGEHTYYRRTFQGDVPMTPFEVQEQILAVREAVISPLVEVGRGASFSSVKNWIAIGYSIHFSIENIGSRACLNPFLRVRSSSPTRSNAAVFDQRRRAWKSKVAHGTLLHVDDGMALFTLEFTARLLLDKILLGSTAGKDQLLAAMRLYQGKDDLHSQVIDESTEIDGLTLELSYGAENAVARNKKIKFSREEIAASLLVQQEKHLSELTMAAGGVWRSDLVAKLKSDLDDLKLR